ncbi:MAG: tyrosine-protein kinase family protein, partial [Flavicella sp.]
FNSPFQFEGSRLQINLFLPFSERTLGEEFYIVVNNKDELITELSENIEFSDYQSSLLTVSLEDEIEQKSVLMLNNLISIFESFQLEEFKSNNTKINSLINQRLDTIHKKITETGKDIEDFKFNNIETVNQATVKDYLSQKTKYLERIPLLNQSLQQIITYIAFLQEDQKNRFNILAIPGFSVADLSSQIQKYNNLVLKRDIVSKSSFEDSPILQNYDVKLNLLFSSIIETLKVHKEALKLELKQVNKALNNTDKLLASFPQTEFALNNYTRKQQVDEKLYTYLKKKEEFTKYTHSESIANFKVIDSAYITGKPYNSNLAIMTFACVFLMGYPFLLFYLNRKLQFTLQNIKDLKKIVSAPVLGDIPLSSSNQNIVVTGEDRSSTTEAFRLVRSNIDFMLSDTNSGCKSIFVTSTISGEGKSFVSVNLAASLALKYNKVALVGIDLRAPKISSYLGVGFKKGITNYIVNSELSLQDISFPFPKQSNLDVFASGIIPPNPSELLYHERVATFFKNLKTTYDCIVVDTAPVNLVTDTLKIAHHADMFVYVCRADYTDKRLLTVAETIFNENRLPKMSMLINASDPTKGDGVYGSYGYGTTNLNRSNWKSFFLS